MCVQYWKDFYLQWNMSDYPGVTNVRFPDSQIWRPDILLYNRCALYINVKKCRFIPHLFLMLSFGQCADCTAAAQCAMPSHLMHFRAWFRSQMEGGGELLECS